MKNKSTALSYPLILITTTAVLFVGILYLYWPVLVSLGNQLIEDEDYSFGLLLPLVSAYLIYLKRDQLVSSPWKPSWIGFAVMISALGLYVIGILGTGRYATRLSFVIFLIGFVVLIAGWGLCKKLSFPLFLLVLTLPLPIRFTADLTLPLQMLSSRLATMLLRLGGMPVFRQGNVIDLGNRQLQVVAACSGLRYILALFALGCIFCYFYQRRPWKVAILLFLIIPGAIIANAFRVAAMGLFPALQEPGFWHLFSGWLIFVFCFALLFIGNWLLNRLQPEDLPSQPAAALSKDEAPALANLISTRRLMAALILVLLAVPVVHYGVRIKPVPLRQSFANFPLELGPWHGDIIPVDPEMIKAVGAHAYFNADYKSPQYRPVSLWIAYYENQETESIGHTPRHCLPGSGWETLESGVTEIAPGKMVNYMIMGSMGNKIIVYYWNLVGGQLVTNDRLNKFYLIYSGLLHRRTDAALIRLIIPAGGDPKEAREQVNKFANLLIPVIPKFIPE
jgi:exosortase D (VPLPA-CTERM-specific)